jgi:hypothetical protein
VSFKFGAIAGYVARQSRALACRWAPKYATPKIVQIHVPRTGGRSIRESLRDAIPILSVSGRQGLFSQQPPGNPYLYLGHLKPRAVIDHALLARWQLEESYSFGVCRNPYTRIMSLLSHFERKGMLEGGISELLRILQTPKAKNVSASAHRIRQMGRPQMYWLAPDGWRGPTSVFRFEDLNFALEEISRVAGVQLLPHATGKNEGPTQFEFGDEEISRIQEIYEADFSSLHYSSQPPIFDS